MLRSLSSSSPFALFLWSCAAAVLLVSLASGVDAAHGCPSAASTGYVEFLTNNWNDYTFAYPSSDPAFNTGSIGFSTCGWYMVPTIDRNLPPYPTAFSYGSGYLNGWCGQGNRGIYLLQASEPTANSNTLGWYVNQCGAGYAAGPVASPVAVGSWAHVCTVFSISNNVVYVNGEAGVTIGASHIGVQDYISFGGDQIYNQGSKQAVAIDEFRFWPNVLLSAAAIQTAHSTGVYDTTGLKLWFDFSTLSSAGNFLDLASGQVFSGGASGAVATLKTSSPVCPPSITGDPQIVGLLGQSFQVHGVPGQTYNLITSKAEQVNAEFVFLSEGQCPPTNETTTLCYTHPGTYLGRIGIRLQSANESTLLLRAGPADQGMEVLLNGRPMDISAADTATILGGSGEHRSVPVSKLEARARCLKSLSAQATAPTSKVDGVTLDVQVDSRNATASSPRSSCSHHHHARFAVQFVSRWVLRVWTPNWTFEFTNSDMFFNYAASFLRIDQVHQARILGGKKNKFKADNELPHGLVGQTWNPKKYNNRWLYLQGDIDEYVLADGLLGVDSHYNKYIVSGQDEKTEQ